MNAAPVSSAPDTGGRAWDRLWWTLLAAGVAVQAWWIVCNVPAVQWNAPRLAVPYALAHGLPIYALRDSGLQLGWFYGPGFPLWYAPVTWLPGITALLVGAAAWNAVTYLAPIAGVLAAGGLRHRLGTGLALALALLLGQLVTHRHFYFVHVDLVCFAFATGALLALHRGAGGRRAGWWHAAALGLALACWTKQIAVALYPAALFWLWREAGGRAALRFGLWAAGYGAVLSVAVLLVFGTEEVLFNTVLVHLRNPSAGGLALLGEHLGELALGSAAWLPALAWACWPRGAAPALPPDAARLVRLLVGAALWSLPLGLHAALKLGGGLNSVHALHYAFLALLLGVLHRRESLGAGWRRPALALVWLALIAVPLANGVRLTLGLNPRWTPDRTPEAFVRTAQAEPGRYYFPWNPLVTLVAERRIQPFDNALFCLWAAGLEPPAEAIRAACPPRPVILYQEPAQSTFALRYFPGLAPREEARP